MKKNLLLFSAITLFALHESYGQINKGATMIGGNIGGMTYSADNANGWTGEERSLNTSIRLGKAVGQNLIIGALLGYAGSTYDHSLQRKRKTRNYQAGFFARKYKPLGSGGFYLFADGSLIAALGKEKIEYPGAPQPDRKITSLGASISPGLSYAVNNWLQLETSFNNLLNLNYTRNKSTTNGAASTSKSFSGGANISGINQINIGFNILINRSLSKV